MRCRTSPPPPARCTRGEIVRIDVYMCMPLLFASARGWKGPGALRLCICACAYAPMHMCHGTLWCSMRPQSLQCQEASRGAQPRMDDAVSRARAMTHEQSISMCAHSDVDAACKQEGHRGTARSLAVTSVLAGTAESSRVASIQNQVRSRHVRSRQVRSNQVKSSQALWLLPPSTQTCGCQTAWPP